MVNNCAEVMCGGRLFQKLALETGKVHLIEGIDVQVHLDDQFKSENVNV